VTGQDPLCEVPAGEPTTGPCAWCGVTTSAKLVIRKASWTTAANGAKVMKKRPVESWVCVEHDRTLVRSNPEPVEPTVRVR
jgi:hypothetical protein